MFRSISLIAGSLLTLMGMESVTLAQELPADPARWINSPPLTKAMLSGKATVFYFVEETCPNCAKNWPGILEATAKFEGQPVLFVAVNSGTSRPEFEAYLRTNNVRWPAINDWDRSFEKQFGFEISLQNIGQVEMLMPDGSFKGGRYNDIPGSATEAAATAKWKVDPTGLPATLRPAWLAIEFGSYADAAKPITRGLAGKGPQLEAAQKLNSFVQGELTAQVAAAQKLLDEGNSWEAYKGYAVIPVRFKGFEIPPEVATHVTDLTRNEEVKREQAAQKLLVRAQQSAAKSPNNLKAAIKQLQTLAKDYPTTEAGLDAQGYLDQMKPE
jgi:thiol-disulfide isomerase/thioredoxin